MALRHEQANGNKQRPQSIEKAFFLRYGQTTDKQYGAVL
jgi:hypothetical protein